MEDIDEVPGRIGIKQCQPCLRNDKRNEAYKYCEDCREYQCEECEKIHQLFPVTSKHKLVHASEASDVKSKYDMKGLDQCKEHRKLMEFFCEDERIPCCGKCAIVSHRKCNHVVDIEETKELTTLDLITIQREFIEIEVKFQKILHHLEKSKDKFTKDALEITDKIQTMQDKVNEMFENLKQTISKDIAKFQKQAFDDFDTNTAVCDSCIADLKQTVADIQIVSEQGSPAQQLIMAQNFKDRGNKLKIQAEKVYAELKDFVLKFEFDSSLKLPPSNHPLPGKLTMNFIKAPEISSDVMVTRQKDQKVKLTLQVSIDLSKGEGDLNEPLYSGHGFLPDGRLVTVDNKNKRCVVFNQNLEKLNTLSLSKCPHGIVVVSEDEVAITTFAGYKLIFIKISKLNEMIVVRECDVKKKFQSISVIDDDSMLVGCIDDPQPVHAVSFRGEDRELGTQFATKTYRHGSSACTYIRNRNKVVFSDRLAHTVYIHDKATNTRVDVKDEKIINEPLGMAISPADCIFVCSVKTNSVVQISHTGEILSSHVMDMRCPRSVCVSNDNTRLACSNHAVGKRKLQLFSIELI